MVLLTPLCFTNIYKRTYLFATKSAKRKLFFMLKR